MYLAWFPTFRCTMDCKWCVQAVCNSKIRDCSLMGNAKLVSNWLIKNKYLSRELSILGGEATIHPDFKWSIENLHGHFMITVTTNLFSGLFVDMGKFIAWALTNPIRWNTSFHPNQGMSVDLYIDRVRMMQRAGLYVDQVSSVDVPDLTNDTINKLISANIGWSLQYATYINNGVLIPRTIADIRMQYPLRWQDYHKYIGGNYITYSEMCSQKQLQTVWCSTDRLLISPDNRMYRCSAHAYRMPDEYTLGFVSDIVGVIVGHKMKCNEYGSCEPCDIGNIEVEKI